MAPTVTTFSAPLCFRKGPHDNDEGFFIVDTAIVAVHHELRTLAIYEKETIDNGGNVPVLQFNIQTDVTKWEFRKIRSASDNFEGGRITIEGIFDRGYEETITIKLCCVEQYKCLARLLRDLSP
jgi:hypothetical protein